MDLVELKLRQIYFLIYLNDNKFKELIKKEYNKNNLFFPI